MRDIRRQRIEEGPYQSREGKFQQKQIRGLLIASYLLERKRPWLIAPCFARTGLVVYRLISISNVAAGTVESMRSSCRRDCGSGRSNPPRPPMPLLLLFADLLAEAVVFPPILPLLPPVPPPNEGRPRLVWPRGWTVPVRRAVCCFWPAIEERC